MHHNEDNLLRYLKIISCWILLVPSAMAIQSYGPTKSGDTLWRIAQKNPLKTKVGIKQIVGSIKRLNAQMLQDNGGILPQGVLIKVPSTLADLKTNVVHNPSNKPVVSHTDKTVVNKNIDANNDAAQLSHGQKLHFSSKPQPLDLKVVTASKKVHADAKAMPLTTQVNHLAPKMVAKQGSEAPAIQTGFIPWAWLWFVVALAMGYLWWRNRQVYQSSEVSDQSSAHETYRFDPMVSDEPLVQSPVKSKSSYQGELLADVMINIAEGSFVAARSKLKVAIKKSPSDMNLRLKLLEVYVKMDDKSAFEGETDAILELKLITKTDDAWGTIRSLYMKQWVYES